tara:strand:- start:178 stop:1050 length:873 start_codon:yes stop_codon:yes gene_type:complete
MSLLAAMQAKQAESKAKKMRPRKKREKPVPEEAFSITICESGENHTGMEILGKKAEEGFSINELMEAKERAERDGFECEYFDLKELGLGEEKERYERADEAGVLIIRDVLGKFGATKKGLEEEMKSFDCDKKYFDTRRQKVLNKNARHNVCFAYKSQKADFVNKKGTIIDINSLKNLKLLISNLHLYFGEKARNLIAELNHYYNVEKCGIGFHGDTERRIVICARLGAPIPMFYSWYENSKRVGRKIELPQINEGDIYVMSDKAVGWDWKLRKNKRLTLRHAAGCEKYTK